MGGRADGGQVKGRVAFMILSRQDRQDRRDRQPPIVRVLYRPYLASRVYLTPIIR